MQLTLTQSDIELALTNYVNEILILKEGMVITVDLKATRGADGATAIIDISPVATEPSKPATTPAPSKQAKPEVKPKAEVKPEVKPDPVDDAADANANDQANDSQADLVSNGEGDGQGGEDGGSDDAAADAGEADAATEAPVVADKPKSLFAGLKKPVNS